MLLLYAGPDGVLPPKRGCRLLDAFADEAVTAAAASAAGTRRVSRRNHLCDGFQLRRNAQMEIGNFANTVCKSTGINPINSAVVGLHFLRNILYLGSYFELRRGGEEEEEEGDEGN